MKRSPRRQKRIHRKDSAEEAILKEVVEQKEEV